MFPLSRILCVLYPTQTNLYSGLIEGSTYLYIYTFGLIWPRLVAFGPIWLHRPHPGMITHICPCCAEVSLVHPCSPAFCRVLLRYSAFGWILPLSAVIWCVILQSAALMIVHYIYYKTLLMIVYYICYETVLILVLNLLWNTVNACVVYLLWNRC